MVSNFFYKFTIFSLFDRCEIVYFNMHSYVAMGPIGQMPLTTRPQQLFTSRIFFFRFWTRGTTGREPNNFLSYSDLISTDYEPGIRTQINQDASPLSSIPYWKGLNWQVIIIFLFDRYEVVYFNSTITVDIYIFIYPSDRFTRSHDFLILYTGLTEFSCS